MTTPSVESFNISQAAVEVGTAVVGGGLLGSSLYAQSLESDSAPSILDEVENIPDFLTEAIGEGIVDADEAYWLAAAATTFEELAEVLLLL